ncbi:SDR family oxidoreductase [Chloroflexota bacterium]
MAVQRNILVTGATGYIGGRLVPYLLESGYKVRVLARDPARLQGRSWATQVDIVQGDVFVPDTLSQAMDGINTVFYLIHSMSGSDDFPRRDLIAADNFGSAAKAAGVARIIYLGGLGDPENDLSEHLKSRQATGHALAKAGVPVTEFRAAIIVGSGSISFEMIRNLTERIPVMICPRWVFTRVQPIAIMDVLSYLVSALDVSESKGKVIEIGGADVVTYGDMMKGYAKVRGLKRALISVPVLTPRLSSYWVHWMTPVPATITRPLIEGLRNEVIVRDHTARTLFPGIQPMDYATAVESALANLDLGNVETRWTDALVSSQGNQTPVVLKTQEGMIVERRQEKIQAPPKQVYNTFTHLGGEHGWLFFDWAWEIRGMMDRLIGGVGLRRGRRDPNDIRVGDAIDFWRVEVIELDKLIRLRAEMKVPGKAWLQFEAQPLQNGATQLIQTAFFAPKGLFGFLYWYGLYPLHSLIFSGLIQKLKELAESI